MLLSLAGLLGFQYSSIIIFGSMHGSALDKALNVFRRGMQYPPSFRAAFTVVLGGYLVPLCQLPRRGGTVTLQGLAAGCAVEFGFASP